VAWTETAHPRNMKGPGGGEFKGGSGAKPAAKPASKKPGAKKAGAAPHGSMSFNGKTGTGYGSKNGDPRVKKLQTMLNKLGLKDAHGKPLAVDGKLGPLTTQAIKAWQRKNGMKADGVVSPAMLAKAGARKTTTAHVRARAAKAKPQAAPKPKPRAPLPKPY
jgi:peptidoglycan hydrolase-like protein with peptidoglycan-binding domain